MYRTVSISMPVQQAVLHTFVFDKSDNRYFNKHDRATIHTCSIKAYPFLKRRLMDVFGSFVVVPRGIASNIMSAINYQNIHFCEEIVHSNDEDRQLIVVPVYEREGCDVPIPVDKNVRFVTTLFQSYGNISSRPEIRILIGQNYSRFDDYIFDKHIETIYNGSHREDLVDEATLANLCYM